MFLSSVSCVKYKCVVQRVTLEEHVFLYEREHLDDAPALVLDLLSTVHENRPLESGRDPSLEAFRRGKGGGELSPDWKDNGFCGIGRGGG